MKNITVVIVTRNRAKDLKECLESLARQKVLPEEVMVINNNSDDNTSEVIAVFKNRLKIEEYIEDKIGYSYVYNRGLKEAKTDWVAFIDDDCVAKRNWYEQIIKSIRRLSNCSKIVSILGQSKNYYSDNVFACLFQYGNVLWREENMRFSREIINYEILDSRNIVHNKKLLNDNKIKFDERLIYGSEDCDLGLQIQNKNLKAKYVVAMIAYHKEPSNLKDFW